MDSENFNLIVRAVYGWLLFVLITVPCLAVSEYTNRRSCNYQPCVLVLVRSGMHLCALRVWERVVINCVVKQFVTRIVGCLILVVPVK
jgi:hypothetical protein